MIVIYAFSKIFNLGKNDPVTSKAEWSSEGDNVVPATSDTTTGPRYNSIMPNLVGMNFQIKQQENAGWLELEPEYVYSETEPKGKIIWQELPEGAEFMSGSTVKVRVSRGTSKVEVPSFTGSTINSYLKELEDMGFVPAVEEIVTTAPRNTWRQTSATSTTTTTATSTYTAENGAKQAVIYKATVNYNYANGNVCKVEPEPGSKIDLQEGYEVIVYYAQNPVVTSSRWTTAASTTDATSTKTTKTTAAVTETEAPPAVTTEPDVTEAPPPPPVTTAPPPPSEGGGDDPTPEA